MGSMGNVTEAFFNGPSAVPEPSDADPAGAAGVSDPGGSSPYGGGKAPRRVSRGPRLNATATEGDTAADANLESGPYSFADTPRIPLGTRAWEAFRRFARVSYPVHFFAVALAAAAFGAFKPVLTPTGTAAGVIATLPALVHAISVWHILFALAALLVTVVAALDRLRDGMLPVEVEASTPGVRGWFARQARHLREGTTHAGAGFGLAALSLVLVGLGGGPAGVLAPVLYVTTVALLGLHGPTSGVVLTALLAIGLAALAFGSEGVAGFASDRLGSFWIPLAIVVGFALLTMALGGVERWRRRHRLDGELSRRVAALGALAESMRLAATEDSTPDSDSDGPAALNASAKAQPKAQPVALDPSMPERSAFTHGHAAALAVIEASEDLLDLVDTVLAPQACLVILRDRNPTAAGGGAREGGTSLTVTASRIDPDGGPRIKTKGIEATGLLATCLRKPEPLFIERASHRGDLVPYHAASYPAGSIAALPLYAGKPAEGAEPIGALIVERHEPGEWDEPTRTLLRSCTRQLERTLASERLLLSVARAKDRQKKYFRAAERLNMALTLEQVYAQILEASREAVPWDAAALSLVLTPRTGEQVIVAAQGFGSGLSTAVGLSGASAGGATTSFEEANDGGLYGRTFKAEGDNSKGLVVTATRKREVITVGRGGRKTDRPVFAPGLDPKLVQGGAMITVIPLVTRDGAVGALTLAVKDPKVWSEDGLGILRVVAQQGAVKIENAKIQLQIERMATTDGLTGLYNRRTFNDRLKEVIARSQRNDQPFTLVICDIDHFKRVNDTYGHDVGDQVIRGVADVLREGARETDIVARYGGEEFVAILELTDAAGAVIHAQRIRERIKARVFETAQGPLSITMSFGLAEFPAVADAGDTLLVRADKALYSSKQNGRDQVTDYALMPLGLDGSPEPTKAAPAAKKPRRQPALRMKTVTEPGVAPATVAAAAAVDSGPAETAKPVKPVQPSGAHPPPAPNASSASIPGV
jgi:diguanylate cyclase (GGDEF)-like protein